MDEIRKLADEIRASGGRVRLEDARKRKWIPNQRGREVLQGVGSVKRDAAIWEDFLSDLGVPFELVAPESAKGRRYDYPVYINTQSNKPRHNEGIDYRQLRALADSYDLLRIIIERRKDQMAKLSWTIQKRDLAATAHRENTTKDSRIDDAAIAFFRLPDKEHTWDTWLRMLLEDLLVIDAACLYPRKTRGGGLYALEPVDGSTIKRLLDNTGRTPMPPEPAYQQILHGMAATEYTREELIYRPRNVRTHKVYGCSPVEQIIATVNIALRRQMHQLEYYQSGSVPDAL